MPAEHTKRCPEELTRSSPRESSSISLKKVLKARGEGEVTKDDQEDAANIKIQPGSQQRRTEGSGGTTRLRETARVNSDTLENSKKRRRMRNDTMAGERLSRDHTTGLILYFHPTGHFSGKNAPDLTSPIVPH